jgi:hypothetical protein
MDVLALIGVILRGIEVILKVLAFLKGKATNRNHPHK